MTIPTIGFVFIQGFADWEFGMLSGAAADWFDLRPVALTPEGGTVRSIGGFRLAGDRGLEPAESEDLNAVAVIGSDGWAAEGAPDVGPLLEAAAARGAVIGGICGGTLALARAGLFEDRAHTSNGRDWIRGHLPDYPGADRYRDVPWAVADGTVVSAPGTAPASFAAAMLECVFPERAEQIAEVRQLLAAEHVRPA